MANLILFILFADDGFENQSMVVDKNMILRK